MLLGETIMFIPPYHPPTSTNTNLDLRKPPANDSGLLDKTTREKTNNVQLSEPKFHIFFKEPLPGKDNLNRKPQFFPDDSPLTLFPVSAANPQRKPERPKNYPNMRISFPASNDDNYGG